MRKIPVAPKLRNILDQQRVAFVQKFGREPGPGDPILFDPNADQPTPFSEDQLNRSMTEGLLLMQVPHRFIYGFLKSGIFLTEANHQHVDPSAREDWNQALDEYDSFVASCPKKPASRGAVSR
jgi:hypothetical protein